MTKIYPYADRSQVQLFRAYAVAIGLNSASLIRLLLVRRMRLNSPESRPTVSFPKNRAKVPVDLPPDLHTELLNYAHTRGAAPAEIAAEEMLFELETRSLEQFLLGIRG
jgi:hypothetical protein